MALVTIRLRDDGNGIDLELEFDPGVQTSGPLTQAQQLGLDVGELLTRVLAGKAVKVTTEIDR